MGSGVRTWFSFRLLTVPSDSGKATYILQAQVLKRPGAGAQSKWMTGTIWGDDGVEVLAGLSLPQEAALSRNGGLVSQIQTVFI